MAASRITTIHSFVGTASERAAMSTTGLPAGSTFRETDTKLVYIWDGSDWYSSPAMSATVDDFTILGELVYTPSTAQVIDAAGDAILANATIVELNPDGDYTLTSTPTIADGTEGQILYITMDPAEANTVTIQDQGTLASSNIQLLNNVPSRTISAGSTLALRFNGTDWQEFGGVGGGTRYITLDFAPAVYADGADNAGTVTHSHDNTNHRNYWRWSSGSANQDIDLVWAFKIPADFATWTTTTAFYVDTRSSSYAGHTMTASLYQADGTVDSGINGADIKPSADDTWQTKSDLPTGSYSAGDWVHLHIHCDIDTAADTIDTARLYFTYLASH